MRQAFLALALFVVVGSANAESESCARIEGQSPVPVQFIQVSHAVYWNGRKVTPKVFDTYLHEETNKAPRAIFHVVWDEAGRQQALKLVRKIQAIWICGGHSLPSPAPWVLMVELPRLVVGFIKDNIAGSIR